MPSAQPIYVPLLCDCLCECDKHRDFKPVVQEDAFDLLDEVTELLAKIAKVVINNEDIRRIMVEDIELISAQVKIFTLLEEDKVISQKKLQQIYTLLCKLNNSNVFKSK